MPKGRRTNNRDKRKRLPKNWLWEVEQNGKHDSRGTQSGKLRKKA